MKLVYGGYALAISTGGAAVSISGQPRRDSTGRMIGRTERWTIHGWLTGANAAALTIVIDALKAAFAVDGLDLGLYTDADVATSHVISSAATLGGVRVTETPSFPEGQGAEYANQRSFQVTLEADFETGGLANLASFVETVSITGTGGPRFVTQVPLEGPAIAQVVSQASPVVITQSGSAIGLASYPTVPQPLLTSGEHVDRRRVEYKSPQRLANGAYRNYEVAWSFEFEEQAAAAPLPNAWGN